jgi:hypothetical protein
MDDISSPKYGYFLEYPYMGAFVYNILTPESSSSLSASESIKAVVANIGMGSNLTSATVYLKVNDEATQSYDWTGNLAFSESDTVDFTADLSLDGRYTIKSWAVAGEYVSDTTVAVVNNTYTVVLPWSDCFDAEHSQWDIIDLNGGSTWTMVETENAGYVAKYNYNATIPGDDWLVTINKFNFTAGGTYFVTVDAYSESNIYIEKYEIYYGKDMENMILAGNKELTLDSVIESDEFILQPTETGEYIVAIRAASEPDMFSLFVNCISVDTGLPSPKVQVSALNLPFSSSSLGASEEAKVVIKNIGVVPIEHADIYVKIGENAASLQTYSGNLPPAETDTVSFILDFSATGVYNIKAWAILDNFVTDTANARLTHSTTVVTLPWKNDFDIEHTEWDIIDCNGPAGTAPLGVWTTDDEILEGNVIAVYTYSTILPGNDFLVTVAPFALKAGGNYNIVASASVAMSAYSEKINVWFGTSPNPADMTLMSSKEIYNGAPMFIEYGFNFTATTDGNYYIAIEAASDPNRYKVYIDYVIVDTGVFVAVPDLALTDAVWNNVYPSCELPSRGQASVLVENLGNGSISDYSIFYKLNDNEWKTTAIQEDTIDPVDYAIVVIDYLDMSSPGKHSLIMAVSSPTADNDTVKLEISTNDPVAVPFNSNFALGEGLEDWTGGRAWSYVENTDYSEYVYAYSEPGSGLMSKCVSLTAGKTYILDMAYWAEQAPEYGIYTSFDVLIGKAGDDISSFDVLASYDRVQTVAETLTDYDETSFEFSIDNSDDYILSILPTEFLYDQFYALFYGASSYIGLSYINVKEKDNVGIDLSEKTSDNALRVYPVPVSTVLTVVGVRNGRINVVDMTGKTVMTRNAGSDRILLDIQTLPDGPYTLHSGDQVVKFIKK